MTIALMAVGVIALLLLRVPVAFALLIPSLAYILLDPTASLDVAVQQMTAGLNSFPLLAVPMFMLIGNLANASGISDRLFTAASAVLGPVRGSLGYVNVFTSFGFSWMSGAAIADAAAMGRVQVPAMVERGYSERFSVGITAGSSLISPILPPSIPAIIYAVTGGVSVGALFAAGILPALLLVGVLCAVVWWSTRGHDELRLPRMQPREVLRALLGAVAPMGAAVIILGGILGGYFTPTEAAGIGVVYVLLLGLAYRELGPRRMVDVGRATIETAGSVLLIVAAAALFGWVLAREQAPQLLAQGVLDLTGNPLVFLLLLNVILLLLGTVLEPTAAILITVPVLTPIAAAFGIDPLHLGMVVIFNLMIGLLTPPVGLVLFVLSSVTDIPVPKVARAVLPVLGPLVVVLLLITFVPVLSLWLPAALGFT